MINPRTIKTQRWYFQYFMCNGQEEAANTKEKEGVVKMSKKARKLASRLTVAELKQLVRRPDVVEVEDCTAADPRLLVYLKSYRNTVPVPSHWSSKSHYLQGRRGVQKPQFKLPGEWWWF